MANNVWGYAVKLPDGKYVDFFAEAALATVEPNGLPAWYSTGWTTDLEEALEKFRIAPKGSSLVKDIIVIPGKW